MSLIRRAIAWLRYRWSLRRRGIRRSATVIFGCIALAPVASVAIWRYEIRRERTAKAYLERAEQLLSERKPRAAAESLQAYLQLKPTDGVVRARLADVYGGAAVTPDEKRRAIELDYEALGHLPDDETLAPGLNESHLRLRLGELLLATEAYPGAEANADRLLTIANAETGSVSSGRQPSSLRSQALRMRALAICEQFRRGSWKNDAGERRSLSEIVAEALEFNPGDNALTPILAQIYREEPQWLPEGQILLSSEERKQRADRLMEGLAQLHSRDCQSLLLVYEYQVKYHLPIASATLDAALAADPKNAAALAAKVAAECAAAESASADAREPYARSHWQSALAYCRQILEEKPTDATASADACEILLQLDDIDAAAETCRCGLSKNADSIRLNLLAAQVRLEQGRPRDAARGDRTSCDDGPLDKAERLLAIAIAENRRNAPETRESLAELRERAALLRGRWFFERGDLRTALRSLEQTALSGTSRSAQDADRLLAEIYSRMGQPDHAAEHYEHLADLHPRMIGAHRAAATCWETAGCLDAAEKKLRRALAIQDSASDWCALSRVLLQQELQKRRHDRRWDAFDEAMARAKKADLNADSLLAWQRERLSIRAAYSGERDLAGGSAASRQRALENLRALEGNRVKSPALLAELAWDYESLEASADADRIAVELLALWPHEAGGYLIEARLASERGEVDRARAAIERGISAVIPGQKPSLERELIVFDLAEDRRQEAETRLEALIGRRKPAEDVSGDGAWLSLAVEVAERAAIEHDESSAQRWERLLWETEGPEGSLWRYVRARRLLETAQNAADPRFTEAGRLQHEISRIRPSWALGYLLGAMMLERRALPEEAADAYRHAVRLGWKQPVVYESPLAAASNPWERDESTELRTGKVQMPSPDFRTFSVADRQRWPPGIETARHSAESRPRYRPALQSDPKEPPIVEN